MFRSPHDDTGLVIRAAAVSTLVPWTTSHILPLLNFALIALHKASSAFGEVCQGPPLGVRWLIVEEKGEHNLPTVNMTFDDAPNI